MSVRPLFRYLAASLIFFKAASVLAAPTPIVLELDSYGDFARQNIQEGIYGAFTLNINARYSIMPETYFYLNFRSGGTNDVNLTHRYLRITAFDNALADLGNGLKLQMGYRYYAPTSMDDQRAGTVGSFYFRPNLLFVHGPWNVTYREIIGLSLQRQSYPLNIPIDQVSSGNELFLRVGRSRCHLRFRRQLDGGGRFQPLVDFVGSLPRQPINKLEKLSVSGSIRLIMSSKTFMTPFSVSA